MEEVVISGLMRQRESGEHCDVLVVTENDFFFTVHSNILAISSRYFSDFTRKSASLLPHIPSTRNGELISFSTTIQNVKDIRKINLETPSERCVVASRPNPASVPTAEQTISVDHHQPANTVCTHLPVESSVFASVDEHSCHDQMYTTTVQELLLDPITGDLIRPRLSAAAELDLLVCSAGSTGCKAPDHNISAPVEALTVNEEATDLHNPCTRVLNEVPFTDKQVMSDSLPSDLEASVTAPLSDIDTLTAALPSDQGTFAATLPSGQGTFPATLPTNMGTLTAALPSNFGASTSAQSTDMRASSASPSGQETSTTGPPTGQLGKRACRRPDFRYVLELWVSAAGDVAPGLLTDCVRRLLDLVYRCGPLVVTEGTYALLLDVARLLQVEEAVTACETHTVARLVGAPEPDLPERRPPAATPQVRVVPDGGQLQVCGRCSFFCHDEERMRCHHRMHGVHSYVCGVCGVTRPKAGQLLRHLIEADHDETVCSLCFHRCGSDERMIEHYLRHNDPRPFFCPLCFSRFPSRTGLNLHMPTHSSLKPFQCSECDQSFKWRHALQAHARMHVAIKQLLCDVCGFSTRHTGQFKAHRARHAGQALPCPVAGCSVRADTAWLLKDHQLTHATDKQYQCEVCGKKFGRARNMRRHALLHGQRRRLACAHCPYQTTRSDKLVQHQRTKHEQPCCTNKRPPASSADVDSESTEAYSAADIRLKDSVVCTDSLPGTAIVSVDSLSVVSATNADAHVAAEEHPDASAAPAVSRSVTPENEAIEKVEAVEIAAAGQRYRQRPRAPVGGSALRHGGPRAKRPGVRRRRSGAGGSGLLAPAAASAGGRRLRPLLPKPDPAPQSSS